MKPADPVNLFLDELDRLLDALYIVGLSGLESAHRADLARLQTEAAQLGLDGVARLLTRLQNADEPSDMWPVLQNLRAWATRFRRRYTLASLKLAPSSRAGLRAPVLVENIPFLEVAVLGVYPLQPGRILLYCLDLRQSQLVQVEDVAFASPNWHTAQSLLFGPEEVDYPTITERKLYLRGLQKAKSDKSDTERLLPALGSTFQELDPVDRLALWSQAQAVSSLRARSVEDAIVFTHFGFNAQKVLQNRAEAGYEARLLIAPNLVPKPKRDVSGASWLPYIAIAAAFRHTTDPSRPRLYSLLNLDDPVYKES